MRVFTIGFTKKSAEVFFTKLRVSGTKRVLDVRLNNISQLAGFSKRDDLVNHLTRMTPGFVCVAGVDLETRAHVRPVLAGRLSAVLLRKSGGPFDIGVVVDLGATQHQGSPPEVEDRLFSPSGVSVVRQMAPREFWDLLKQMARADLSSTFGAALLAQGRG